MRFVLALSLLTIVPAARAHANDLSKDCRAEIAEFCPEAKSQDDIQSCLEKREELGKSSGLSKKCYNTHEKLESPEHEKSEHHRTTK